MNYLTHYFFNRHIRDDDFHVGVAIPDILSAFHRKARPDFGQARRFAAAATRATQRSFWRGLLNHEHGDSIFHSSDYFKHFTDKIKGFYRTQKFQEIRVRSWFLAHITLEIVLDHVLLKMEPGLTGEFYQAFAACSDESVSQNTLAVLPEGPFSTTFSDYLKGFQSSRFLEHYHDIEGITEAVNRVCLRARQDVFEGENRQRLRTVMEQSVALVIIPESLEDLDRWRP